MTSSCVYWKTVYRIGVNFLDTWLNSPVNLSGTKDFFLGNLKIIHLISLIIIRKLKSIYIFHIGQTGVVCGFWRLGPISNSSDVHAAHSCSWFSLPCWYLNFLLNLALAMSYNLYMLYFYFCLVQRVLKIYIKNFTFRLSLWPLDYLDVYCLVFRWLETFTLSFCYWFLLWFHGGWKKHSSTISILILLKYVLRAGLWSADAWKECASHCCWFMVLLGSKSLLIIGSFYWSQKGYWSLQI